MVTIIITNTITTATPLNDDCQLLVLDGEGGGFVNSISSKIRGHGGCVDGIGISYTLFPGCGAASVIGDEKTSSDTEAR